MTLPFDSLETAVVYFGDRKKDGRISVIVDVSKEDGIYLIPRDREHVTFVADYLGIPAEKIKENPYCAAHIVPSHIQIEYKQGSLKLSDVETGESGLEIKLGVRHTQDALLQAHARVLDELRKFVDKGVCVVDENICKQNKIHFEYLRHSRQLK